MSKIKRSVSMYSLQDQYARGYMSLEDMFIFLKEQDTGLELISDQLIKKAPHPDQEMLKKWDALVAEYQPTLVCNDVFINTCLYDNRTLTAKENLQLLIDEIKLANRLGFKMIRLVSNTPTEIIEPALPYAREYDVCMTMEIHAGMSFGTPFTDRFVEVIRKTASPYLGLTVDAGIFCRRHPRVSKEFFRAQGTNDEVVAYIDNIFEQGIDPKQYFDQEKEKGNWHDQMPLPKDLAALVRGESDVLYSIFSTGYEASPFSILDEHMPYVKHIHGKIYEMTEAEEEYAIPYEELIAYLDEKDYDGYVSTEYEGNRFALDGEEIVEKQQVIRHQNQLKKLIEALA